MKSITARRSRRTNCANDAGNLDSVAMDLNASKAASGCDFGALANPIVHDTSGIADIYSLVS